MLLQSVESIRTDACRMVVLLVLLCAAFAPSGSSAGLEIQPQTAITFAQLSDAHIFDDGWNLATADALRQGADDRVALHWAVERINQLVVSGVSIDFVVFTGDFGLQNVDFPASGTCKPLDAKLEPGLPMVPLRWAVNEVGTELKQLAVRRVFVLAGNNDLLEENVLDTRRFDCFLSELQTAVRTYSPPLQISELNADSVVAINGIHLAGLNSASFKKLVNYNQACSNPPAPADAAMLREACPDSQMTLLRQFNADRPLVLFTHVPDLKDPYRKTASWEIQPKVRQLWEKEICGPGVAAVFAGHFHDANRSIYATATGTRDLAVSDCVAGRTWVAPPLAAKNQVGKYPQARGFLLATVAATGVQQAQAIWYEPPITAYSHQPTRARLFLVAGLAVFFILAVSCLIFLTQQNLLDGYRDVAALIVVSIFVEYAFVAIWLAKNKFGIIDSVIVVALLVVPLLLYGIVSGRLTEFSGPGGWGAKFREAARQPVDTSLEPIDLEQVNTVEKENYNLFHEQIRRKDIQEGKPVILTMIMGKNKYNTQSWSDYLRDLSNYPNFKLTIIRDDNNGLVAYIPVPRLKRASELQTDDFKALIDAINRGDKASLLTIPGVFTRTMPPRTTNANALRTMEKYGLEAIPVVDKDNRVLAIADRERILSHMILALIGADKI